MLKEELETVLGLIREIEPYEDIEQDTELIESGILDSLTILVLLNEIESVFSIKIDEKDVEPSHFTTPITIVNMIHDKKNH